jgi:type I restriction enzyme R subunit
MTQFAYLQREWPAVFDAAMRSEAAVHADPRTACFYARRALELAVSWTYKYDSALKLPYQDNLSALLHDPSFRAVTGDAVFSKARVIVTLGNRAVHSHRPIPVEDAAAAVRELFHVTYWLARTYGKAGKPAEDVKFDPSALPKAALRPGASPEQLKQLQTELESKDEKLTLLLVERTTLDEELTRLRAEVAKAKKVAAGTPDTHDYSETETRDYFIDLLLKEAGWPLDQARDREFRVSGMPNAKDEGFVDYVLWGDDGKPLGLVEAKRTRRDPRVGQQQAKLYADCLEKQFGQRPLIFYSNGYEHWLWDDANYPPRSVQGFYKKAEFELAIQRRSSRKPLSTAEINTQIVERFYQSRAIRRIAEAFERDHDRKALLVMATGAGKTRTVIALSDMFMRTNWVKRVLFLADRVALVNQAVNAFKQHLPESSPVNLVTEREAEGRVFVSTYPTMMGLIDDTRDGQRRFGVGHFDLVVIDEAHRSVFQKYRAIFDYFDSFLVGLTATPKDEVEKNTYSLFDLESGVPTDAYSLKEAVKDGYLVPPKAISVPVKFQLEGIKYEKLSEEEKERWDALEWGDDGAPQAVDPEALNQWLFNKDTVDKVLAHLMTHGLKVAGGDRLAKTILFAKNQDHADFIAERFDVNYPHLKGAFARTITFRTEYAQSLIDTFSSKEKSPHLAISVDMLDTGIDISELANLVFFKLVRSKTKFWQMIGRGTRLCKDLFGPGQDKKYFLVFDYCENLEFFSEEIETTEGATQEPLGTKLFKRRLEMLGELDERLAAPLGAGEIKEGVESYADPKTDRELRREIAGGLHREVASMNIDNFVVRPKRRFVEEYSKEGAWQRLTRSTLHDLSQELAGLPTELEANPEEAKRFDLLILKLQLAVLRSDRSFERLRDQVKGIAGLLSEKTSIPMVNEQMPLILDLLTDEWWRDVTAPMLETVRRRLRKLVALIDKASRTLVYSDFEDAIGTGVIIDLPGLAVGTDYEKFRAKARDFLRSQKDNMTLRKVILNKALTQTDLAELERLLAASGAGGVEEIARAKKESSGLGLFVREMVGLDREAAKAALAGFLAGKTLTSSQIEFVDLVINQLTERGMMDPAALYSSPFTDLTSQGPEALFTSAQVDELVGVLERVKATALAA